MLELLRRFGWPYRRYMVLGPASKLVEVVFDLLTPLVVAGMIDRAVAARSVGGVVAGAALLAAMALAGFASTLVCQKMAARASQGLGTELRDALFSHVNELSCAELDRFGTPSLITRITNDVNQVQLALALGIRQLARFPLLAVGSVMAAMLIDVQLGLVFLVAMPLIGLVFWLVMARCIPYYRQLQRRLDRVGLITREGLSGARVVRAFVREGHERERFDAAATAQAATAIAAGKLSSVLNPVTFFIMNMAVCAILWMGGGSVSIGALTQGQVMAFVNYMMQAMVAIVYVANLVMVCTRASASAGRILEVLDCEPSIVWLRDAAARTTGAACGTRLASGASQMDGRASADMARGDARVPGDVEDPGRPVPSGDAGELAFAPAGESLPADEAPSAGTPLAPAIRFDRVSFTYPDAASPALRGISLEVPRGGTLGIIGGTGSGKSTLVSLLARLYDAGEGRIEILGTDVRTWPMERLRDAIGLVPQQAQLMSGTIRSNLQWRDAAATDAELWDALETAQAADVVRRMPDGLDARIEAGGKNLSGGQRQRLSIARALVGSPAILVLDDAASALDYKTDAALRGALARRRTRGGASATTVIVSQRVSAVRQADLVCVLYHGEVAGLGTHDELAASCQLYREICRSQGVEVPGAETAASDRDAAGSSWGTAGRESGATTSSWDAAELRPNPASPGQNIAEVGPGLAGPEADPVGSGPDAPSQHEGV